MRAPPPQYKFRHSYQIKLDIWHPLHFVLAPPLTSNKKKETKPPLLYIDELYLQTVFIEYGDH